MALSKPVITSESYVEDMLTCSICLDLVKDPRTLQQCFHSFCHPCINQVMEKQANDPPGVICPNCRSFSKDDEIRKNFFINDLLHMHKNSKEEAEGKKKLCQQCSTDDDEFEVGEAKYKCLDCRIDICSRCKNTHTTIPLLKGHRILPLSQEMELVIDHLVFCQLHDSETIKFYCKECDLPICITCKVTDHESHETKTVEKALSVLVAEAMKYVGILEDRVSNYDKACKDLDRSINDIETSYRKCCLDIEAREAEYIETIKKEAKKSQEQLLKQKEIEMQKLQETKRKIQNKRKEEENIKIVTKTSIERARHATLLTELVHGNVANKLKELVKQKPDSVYLDVKVPSLLKTKEKGTAILPDLDLNPSYDNEAVSVNLVPIMQSRLWPNGFAIISKIKKKELTITLPDKCLCTRLSIIQGKIWAPLTDSHKIQIYSRNGQLEREIDVQSPRNVVQVSDDIIIASKEGLYRIDEGFTVSKLISGKFCDIAVHETTNDILTLEHDKMELITFGKDKSTGKLLQMHVFNLSIKNKEAFNIWCTTVMPIFTSMNENIIKYMVVHWRENMLGIYDNKCNLIKSVIISGKLVTPYLCGIDKESNVLFADRSNFDFQLVNMNTYEIKKVETNIDLSGVFDIHIAVNCVWLLQYDEQTKKYEIMKYLV